MRHHSYLHTAKSIIETYKGTEPLAFHIKKFFAKDKKYGSRDRKQITALCYHYYRLGKALPLITTEEKIILATFLCEQTDSEFLQLHAPELNQHIALPIQQKLNSIVADRLVSTDIFPWVNELSDGIDANQFIPAFFIQPDLFIRVRPGRRQEVLRKLKDTAIINAEITDTCIALPNSSKLDDLFDLDKEVVVQDYNSQQVLDILEKDNLLPEKELSKPVVAWDCCAASGGKSILLYDKLKGNIALTVSDIRENILANLKKRFYRAGIKQYHAQLANLAIPGFSIPILGAQIILCDVPCTGSGTWGRTPEQLYYFTPRLLKEYTDKQKAIIKAVIPYLQTGALLFYITCSVFKKENEEMASFITNNYHLQLIQMNVLKGYDKKADNMFVAVFRK